MGRKTWAFITLICSGCSAEKAGLAELQMLCEGDAGVKISKSVEADGFFDSSKDDGALRVLISSTDFNFIEFCESQPNIASLFDETGCWRLMKVRRESAQCSAKVDEILISSNNPLYVKFADEFCVAVEGLEQPAARYEYIVELETRMSDNEISEFVRSNALIRDRTTGEVISEYISYSFNAKPGMTAPISCNVIDDDFPSYDEANLIEDTFSSTRR